MNVTRGDIVVGAAGVLICAFWSVVIWQLLT
jgi:hypothetical protein